MAVELTVEQARRVAVSAQLLAAPQPKSVLETVRGLGSLQIDPTSAVARAEHLVLWSRLGPYDVAELDRLRWQERSLFEYAAFIVPASDYALHRPAMRRHPRPDSARGRYVREWLAQNS